MYSAAHLVASCVTSHAAPTAAPGFACQSNPELSSSLLCAQPPFGHHASCAPASPNPNPLPICTKPTPPCVETNIPLPCATHVTRTTHFQYVHYASNAMVSCAQPPHLLPPNACRLPSHTRMFLLILLPRSLQYPWCVDTFHNQGHQTSFKGTMASSRRTVVRRSAGYYASMYCLTTTCASHAAAVGNSNP